MANDMSAKPHKMACGVVRFFICLSFACCGARIADFNDMEIIPPEVCDGRNYRYDKGIAD